MDDQRDAFDDLLRFPLVQAIFGRRSRRFGLGMEIASGPLAHTSRFEPYPLSELERYLLVAAGTGVTGWNWGVPFTPVAPSEHATLTVRFTGRTGPTAAGIGTPVLLHTSDDGTFLTNTRDARPDRVAMFGGADDAQRIVDVCKEHTVRLSPDRLDVPPVAPYYLEPNHWMANAEGSTIFFPIADASEQFLAILAILVTHGHLIVDGATGRPAGDLDRFVRSGLIDDDDPFPLGMVQQLAYEANAAEVAFMAHNIVLTMQAMGLGGLFYTGFNRFALLGAFADEGVNGLGFRFVTDERWPIPDPVGIDGHFEALCPPYHPDMRSAVETFVARKFGPGGAYDPEVPGPWKDAAAVKKTVTPYSEELVDCLVETADYVHRKHGRFPGTFSTIVLNGVVQVQHLDTEYYDRHLEAGSYLETHATHMERWHGEGPVLRS